MAPNPSSRTERQPLPPETMELIHRSGSGDRRAVELLIGRYQARVARFVISETGERHHYEDLCQAIFVKMAVSLPKLRGPAVSNRAQCLPRPSARSQGLAQAVRDDRAGA
jgi:hypothetical protein